MQQVEMISLEDLVPENHSYREFCRIWSFKPVEKRLRSLEKENPHKGYGLLRLFKCLLLQFMENLSDRELERYMQENTAAKWFCRFNLREKTPDHSIFCQVRKKIGTNVLSKIFTDLRDQLKKQGLISEVFIFVDAAHLISKTNLWKERDQAINQSFYCFLRSYQLFRDLFYLHFLKYICHRNISYNFFKAISFLKNKGRNARYLIFQEGIWINFNRTINALISKMHDLCQKVLKGLIWYPSDDKCALYRLEIFRKLHPKLFFTRR